MDVHFTQMLWNCTLLFAHYLHTIDNQSTLEREQRYIQRGSSVPMRITVTYRDSDSRNVLMLSRFQGNKENNFITSDS